MSALLLIIMLAAGIFMSFAILLMAPKWGLWFWLWGMWWSNEYGTKKSIEGSLKTVATIGAVVFVVTALIYPFTKEKTYNPDSNNWTWSVTNQNFDLGWVNSGAVENEVVVGTGN